MSRPFHVLIAGGGVAALEAALALRAHAEDLVDVELLAPESDFVYRPLATLAPFHAGEVARFPLRALAEQAGARLRPGRLTAVDAEEHVVFTDQGETVAYDGCLLALGAVPSPAVAGAVTFGGPGDEDALRRVLDAALDGSAKRIVFALPSSVGWTLPAYELAMLTAGFLEDAGATGTEVVLVTPEDAPLALFGGKASESIDELLRLRGVEVRARTVPLSFGAGTLRIAPDGEGMAADAVIAMPRLEGPRIDGVTADAEGFVPVDPLCAVSGLDDVWAAGDLTTFRVKQGGIAAQQADAAAEAIASAAGADLDPAPFRPVLRGLLFTGLVPRFLGTDVPADTEPLWWPPTKIVGRYLSPFLAGLTQSMPA